MKVSDILEQTSPIPVEQEDEPMNILTRTQGGEHPKFVRRASRKLLRKYKHSKQVPMWFRKQAESVEV